MNLLTGIAIILAGLILMGCKESSITDGMRKSTNIEDYRTKPKTAFLINGLGVYTKPGMMGAIQHELQKRGWKVTVLNHTDGRRLTHMPRVIIGHSMGANAALKASQKFIKNHPDLIVSIDAGRSPLFHLAPKSKARVVDIMCPYHPIGGQAIMGAAVRHQICGTAHISMPHDSRVIKIIVDEVEKLK